MKIILTLILISSAFSIQDLNSFVQKALKQNMSLNKSQAKINQFKSALLESRGDLLPSIDISSRYSRAGGGRTIDFPIGDLLNPVYSGLFQLTNNPAYNVNLENESINFLREKEHDTKISLTQIIDYRLWLVQDLKADEINLSEAEKNILETKISFEVIKSYLSLIKLENILESLNQNISLLEKTLKNSKALYEAKTILKTNLLEIEIQIMTLNKEKLNIQKSISLTKKYLNHMIDEDLDKDIKTKSVQITFVNIDHEQSLKESRINRNEFKVLNQAESLLQSEKAIKSAAYLPQVIIKADFGYQGESYQFNTKQDYWMLSGILNYNLFNGFSDTYAEEISETKLNRLKIERREIEQKIEMELDEAILNYRIQKEQIDISEKQVRLANENYKIQAKKFAQGLSNQLEYMNAFSMKKNASIAFETDKIELILLKYKLDSVTGSLVEQFK